MIAAKSANCVSERAKLEEEIDRLQRTEEAAVVATGAPREPGCPPWCWVWRLIGDPSYVAQERAREEREAPERPETAADVGIDCPQCLGGFLRA